MKCDRVKRFLVSYDRARYSGSCNPMVPGCTPRNLALCRHTRPIGAAPAILARHPSLEWTVSACVCVLVASCNSLVGNAEHDVTAGDASGGLPLSDAPFDAGPMQVWDASATDAISLDAARPISQDAPRADGPTAPTDGSTDDGVLIGAPIAFIQAASQDSKDSARTVSATYAHPQQAGNLDVVVVGWSDPATTLSSIGDSAGNSYALAGMPTSTSGAVLAIYYASNIASAASNTVTVHLDASDFPCVAVLEYTGVTRLDQTTTGSGASATASSGTVVTSAARELVFGAGQPDQNHSANFSGAGSGLNLRVITGISGMLAEDAIVSEVGTYAATAPLTRSSSWVMRVATFE